MQLSGVRAENNALRNELAAAQKRTADVEERLRAVTAQGRSAQRGANGIAAGFLSNKKARVCSAAVDICTACQGCRSCLPVQADVREDDASGCQQACKASVHHVQYDSSKRRM